LGIFLKLFPNISDLTKDSIFDRRQKEEILDIVLAFTIITAFALAMLAVKKYPDAFTAKSQDPLHYQAIPFVADPRRIVQEGQLCLVCQHSRNCKPCRRRLQSYFDGPPIGGLFEEMRGHLNAEEIWGITTGRPTHMPRHHRMSHLSLCDKCRKQLKKTR
jgi:hypothetical protein